MVSTALRSDQLAAWEHDGYLKLDGFADATTCARMHDHVVDLCRRAAAGESIGDSLVDPERNAWDGCDRTRGPGLEGLHPAHGRSGLRRVRP